MQRDILGYVRGWMYRNARPLELSLWKYHFENGSKEDVLDMLRNYQNADGGFGHALEPDNWNPNSSPIQVQEALNILREIDFWDMEHPVYQGIWNYIKSETEIRDYGWAFTMSSNDAYPHAPWWNYNEESNRNEYYGVTADLTAFILKYGEKESVIYKKAQQFSEQLIGKLLSDEKYGDMGISGFIHLVHTITELGTYQSDEYQLKHILAEKVKHAIEHDVEKWKYYGVRPSNYITSPESIFYEENKEIVEQELSYLLDIFPSNDVWGITWTWFDNMERYEKQFTIAENWWKGKKAIEKLLFLRNFGRI